MQVAVLTFDGFNELDSFVAAAIINRLHSHGWAAHITAPTETVTSLNGVTVHRQRPLEFLEEADAVLIGSGVRTREIAADPAMLARLRLDPTRQLPQSSRVIVTRAASACHRAMSGAGAAAVVARKAAKISGLRVCRRRVTMTLA